MNTEKAPSEERAARRTKELQAAIETLSKEVIDRTQAVEDRKGADRRLVEINESLKAEISGRAEDREGSKQQLLEANESLQTEITGRAEDRRGSKQELLEANESLQTEITGRTLAESEFGRMFDATPDMMALGGLDGFYKRVNPALLHTMGYNQEELLATPLRDLIHPDDYATMEQQVATLAKGDKVRNLYYRVKHKQGHYLHTEWTDVPLVDGGVFFTMGRDISARIEMEESLRQALASMGDAQRIGMVGSWEIDPTTGVSDWSDETFRICGFTPGEVTPHLKLFLSIVHPDDLKMVREAIATRLAVGEQRRIAYRVVLKDDETRDVVAKLELVQAPDGSPPRLRGTCQDVTEQRHSERKQENLEEQIRSSQKMEAVGSLAGGIAHDFNNLLSVILLYVGFVMDALPLGDPRRDDLLEAEKAAERAATLTRQLLAFGRKQVLKPVLLNLNDVASGMEKMLRRIINEDISLVPRFAPELGLTMADPGQIEQVIMNLVANAKDAMPTGGRLMVETANVQLQDDQVDGLKAGPYVMLAVSDTGCGMSAATKARVFEPFFTTKEVGKGTGLGLPTVYGIVKQSGGHVTVYSETDVGSTFRVYLPRDLSAAPVATATTVAPINVKGTETILIVEDESAVRHSASRILAACGYKVLMAANGLEALQVFETHKGPISLVLTDVTMPKMSGELLAREVATRWPKTRILFMSGYSGDAILRDGKLDPGTQFIGKPFNATDLTRKVREVLDARRTLWATDPTEVAPSRKVST